MVKFKRTSFVNLIFLCIIYMLYQPASYVYAGRDWSTLEIITSNNINRLVNLHNVPSTGKRISDLVSYSTNSSLFVGYVSQYEHLHLLKAQESQVDVQILDPDNQAMITSITFSPTGTFFGSSNSGSEVTLWNIMTGEKFFSRQFELPTDALDFHPQSSSLAICLFDRIAEWNLDSLSQTRLLVMPGAHVVDMDFSSSGNILAIGMATGVDLIDWQNQEDLFIPITNIPNKKVIFNTDGTILAFMNETGDDIGLWNISQNTRIMVKETGSGSFSNDIAFNVDGQLFGVATAEGLELYNGITGSYISTLTQFTSEITALSFSNDGRFLMTGHADGAVNIWGVPPENTIETLQAKVNLCVIDKGIRQSLNAKINAEQWQAFINEVEAQRGKKIDTTCADELIRMATALSPTPMPTKTPKK